MNISEAVKKRRSIRSFQKKEIPDDVIDKLIEALIWAPSAGNLQARKFYFVKDNALKQKLAEAALDQTFIAQVPLVIVGCSDNSIAAGYGERGVQLYSIQDVSCSIMQMMLVALENDLGTAWVGAFHEKEAAKILNLPSNLRPIAIVPVGYPSENPPAPQRVSKENAVEFM